jgi:hypothetical protein
MPKQRRLSLVWVANFGNPQYAPKMEALAESRGVSLTIKRRIMDRELAALSWWDYGSSKNERQPASYKLGAEGICLSHFSSPLFAGIDFLDMNVDIFCYRS